MDESKCGCFIQTLFLPGLCLAIRVLASPFLLSPVEPCTARAPIGQNSALAHFCRAKGPAKMGELAFLQL